MAGPDEKRKDGTPRQAWGTWVVKELGDSRRGVGKNRAGGKGRGVQGSNRQELGRKVAQELLKFRPILKDVGTALLDRLDGDLAGLALWLNGEGLLGDPHVLPSPSVLSAMLADISGLKVKPKKGRVKDLRRIEALLELLSARMSSARGGT